MKPENLHRLIECYENHLEDLNNEEHHELFKWKAVGTWQREWNRPENANRPFAERYAAATKDFNVFIDNARMHPSAGVCALAEYDEARIKTLFCNVLLSEAEDANEAQLRIDQFLNGYEQMRLECCPGNWSYKQDRHTASVYLAANSPETAYIYKSSEAQHMADFIEFDEKLGSGNSFSLERYYRMCDLIAEALKEHPSLIEKHKAMLGDGYYKDESLHLMVFDLIYCFHTYSFFRHLMPEAPASKPVRTAPAKAAAKPKTPRAPKKDESMEREKKRREKIQKLQSELEELERKAEACEEISLLNVEVTSAQYGKGIITAQDKNKITVQFGSEEKKYILDEKYTARPAFENDAELIRTFTEYGRIQDEIRNVKREIQKIHF